MYVYYHYHIHIQIHIFIYTKKTAICVYIRDSNRHQARVACGHATSR